jgi:dTDP-4-dehydrorhamnose reductase
VVLVVFGAAGQLGRAVCALASGRGIEARALPRGAADVTDPDAVMRAVAGGDVVVNCAAFTAVDRAESEREAAFAVNRDGAANVAAAAAAVGAPLLHLSTDFVFDGNASRPWREEDAPAPLNVYGESKLAGEHAVLAAQPRSIVLRTGWLFSGTGQNFVRTMLRLAGERDEIAVVDDQIGGPTPARELADAILRLAAAMAQPGFADWGLLHYGGAPATSWYGFAAAILAGRTKPRLRAVTSAEYRAPARRPLYSVLDCSRAAARFGLAPPDWRPALHQILREHAA